MMMMMMIIIIIIIGLITIGLYATDIHMT